MLALSTLQCSSGDGYEAQIGRWSRRRNNEVKRREFLAVLATTVAWRMHAAAQPASLPIVGILSGTNRDERNVNAILLGLKQSGFEEGHDFTVEYGLAQGQFDRLPALAQDMVRRPVSVIIGIQSANAPRAAKNATSRVPIVFAIGGDPVGLGLVESLSRPGGNVTGTTFLVNTLAAKRLELLHELLPNVRVMGLLVNPKNPASPSETADVQAAARTFGLELLVQNAGNEQDIDRAFATFAEHQVGGVTFAADAVYNAGRARLVALAAHYKMPTMYFYRAFANAGGLISYGGYDTDAYRLAGVYAGRILKGENPADLPVQQVTKVELVINLKTATALGLTVPPTLLATADEVIE
jgi:putative ABC transport system substrate-binding protein